MHFSSYRQSPPPSVCSSRVCSPCFFCFLIFFPYVPLPPFAASIRMASSLTTPEAILCHFMSVLFHFLPMCPTFLGYNQTLSPFPQIPSATPAFSPPFSICLSPSSSSSSSSSLSLFPLPPSLFCSPAAHKNSSFLSPEDSSVTVGFTAFLYAFAPSLSPYLSPLVSLCFGSTTQQWIQPILSFVFLTHLYPSLSPSVLSFSIPSCL